MRKKLKRTVAFVVAMAMQVMLFGVLAEAAEPAQVQEPKETAAAFNAEDTLLIDPTPAPIIEDTQYGDVDDDGHITVRDALMVLKDVVGSQKLDDFHAKVADVDSSGNVTVSDALFILKYVVGTIDRFPAETAAE